MNHEIDAVEPGNAAEQALCDRVLSRSRTQIAENQSAFASAYVIGFIIYDLDDAESLEVSLGLNADEDWNKRPTDESVEPFRKWDWHYWTSEFDRPKIFGSEIFPEDEQLLKQWLAECASNFIEDYREQLIRFWGLIVHCGLLLRSNFPKSGIPLLIDNGILDDWPVDATIIANPNQEARQLLEERFY